MARSPVVEVNPQFFDDLWIAHQPDRAADRADFWNRRAASYDEHAASEESSGSRRLLVDRLADKAGLNGESLVLDIGCGPGRHAVLFARRAALVEGCDVSAKMMELAAANAAGLDNVRLRTLDWAAADLRALGWGKKFHLALASNTPAVNDRAALEKMMAASRGFCCLITQVDVQNSILDQLKPLVDWDNEKARLCRSFYCAFNLLWLMGCYPEVEYFDRAWESDSSLEEAELMYVRYLESVVPLTPAQRKNLAAKLKNLSRGGLVHERVKSRAAMVFWPVIQ